VRSSRASRTLSQLSEGGILRTRERAAPAHGIAWESGAPPAAADASGRFSVQLARVFHWATAKLERGSVILESAAVEKPLVVRYGWADDPIVTLRSRSGMPASPFHRRLAGPDVPRPVIG